MLTNDLNSLEETERGKWNQISLQRTDKEINREGVKRREEREKQKKGKKKVRNLQSRTGRKGLKSSSINSHTITRYIQY